MIDILLSTYNGDKYLREQLDSIISQTYQKWRLIIRDDGSTDNTLSVIDSYCKKYPNNFLLLNNKIGNVGVIRSFESLLQHSTADYIMFCDQDDVWLPNKIELTFSKLKEIELKYGQDIPLLIHTDLFVVDRNLNIINNSFWKYSNIWPELLDSNLYYIGLCNSVTGCTLLMNKKLKEVSTPFPLHTKMHDMWLAVCAKKYGKIDYITTPTIKYRQHNGNVLGAVKPLGLFHKLLQIKTIFIENKKQYKLTHSIVFQSVLEYLYYKIKYKFVLYKYINNNKKI